MVVVKWVLIEFYNVVDGVMESFWWDGVLVGVIVVNILIMFDNCDVCILFNQVYCSVFVVGVGIYYYGIVIVGMWYGRVYLFLYIKVIEW